MALVLVAIGWLVVNIQLTLIIFFFAYLLMAGLSPITELLEQRRWPKFLAIGLPYLVVPAIFVGLTFAYLPQMADQASQLTQMIPQLLNQFTRYLPFRVANPDALIQDILSSLNIQPQNIFSVVSTVGQLALEVVAVIVVSVYMILEKQRIHQWIASWFPRNEQRIATIIERIENDLGRWLQGQLIISVMVGLMVWIFLAIVGIPFAPFLAVLAAIFELVPYVGPIIAAVPAVLLAASVSPTTMVIVVVGYTAIQQIEGHLLVPNVMKNRVGLPALVIIAVIIAGGELAGIIGAIMAVPLAAVAQTLLRTMNAKELSQKTTDS